MRLVALAFVLGLAAAPVLAQETPAVTARQITVTGTAEAQTVPDLATITAGVETRAETAAAALAANSEAMAAVLAALDGSGVARRDVQTSQLSISPVYEPYREGSPEAQKVSGYEAANMVTVRVRAIAGLGGTVDAVTKAGANRLYGISFDISDPKPALDTARRQAVADARDKATLFAEAAGVKLGPVVRIGEAVNAPGPMVMRAEAMADKAAPVEGGTVSLQAQVEIVYALE
jgi:uncharacterized protein YggE